MVTGVVSQIFRKNNCSQNTPSLKAATNTVSPATYPQQCHRLFKYYVMCCQVVLQSCTPVTVYRLARHNSLEDFNILVLFSLNTAELQSNRQLTFDNRATDKLARGIKVAELYSRSALFKSQSWHQPSWLRQIVNIYQSFRQLQLRYQNLEPGHNYFSLHNFPTHSLRISPFYNIQPHLLPAPVNK